MTATEESASQAEAPEQAANTKYRFGLGSLFMLVLSVALVLAWITQIMLPQERLREDAIRVFMNYGGRGYSHSWSPFGISVSLDLRYSEITSRGLQELADNPVVVELNLASSRITDDDLHVLAGAEALEKLTLTDTRVSDAAIEELRAARPDLEIILGESAEAK